MKSLFLADKAHLNRFGRPITFDNYVAMKNGPVPSFAYDILKGDQRAMRSLGLCESLWISEPAPAISQSAKLYKSAKRSPDHEVLSPSDMDALLAALSTVSSLTFRQIYQLTHSDPAYEEAWQAEDGGRQAYPMSLGLLFDVPNYDRAEELKFISKYS